MGNCITQNLQQYENVEFTEGDTYEGEMENKFAEGWGVYTRKNGDRYIGWWHNGFQHGIGKEIFADKTEYEGTFVEGKKHGKGKVTFPDGSSYEGDFQKDSFSGEGVYSKIRRFVLFIHISKWDEVNWYNKYLIKFGKWIDIEGQQIIFEYNRKEGSAQIVFENGNIFECQYKNDMKNGEGLFKWPDGCKFQSNWVDGQLQGESKLIENDIMSIGEWLNNKCVKWEQLND